PAARADDPFLALEDVTGEPALAWVRARNAECQKALAEGPGFQATYDRVLAILDSKAKIPFVGKQGAFFYNLWQDAQNPRGLWRRTTLDEYQKDEPGWETVLDLDALGKQENENWVWKGATFLQPGYDRALLSLSRGGADAVVVREFDVVGRRFVADGFVLPEAKGTVSWRTRDELFVATDFGPGSMTTSGYPRIGKLWRRGTALAAATTVAEGRPEDVSLHVAHDPTKGFERDLVRRGITFYTNEVALLRDGKLVKIDKPDSANASVHREWLFLVLRDDWQVGGASYTAGSLLACRLEVFLAGSRTFDVLFAPTERSSLAGFSPTRNHVLLNVLDNVRNRVFVLTHGGAGWRKEPLPGLPEFGTIGAGAVDDEEGDDYFLTITDYLTPTSLWYGTVGKGPAVRLKSLPAFFATEDLQVEQREATSADGTVIPYFLVGKRGLPRDGTNPTLLHGYGGFEVSMTPFYSGGFGVGWLEQGGVFAVANVRGGGEFGPRWHQAALKQNRNRAFEDFAAVAQDLIAQQITSPRHLGVQGGSNGGLLVGNMLTTYPELFSAIVCQAPLLDMLRYHKLLAGASWIGEYGNPDEPAEAAWLRRYSPYHNLDANRTYPKVLFTTSTRDDRVHPGHARKTMARLMALGKPALYYENIEGGHGGAADNKQAAYMAALAFTFLWQQLK
ncbi:MAG: S9 family peptidase, partial [Planctomycetes bacterium]|nr:S9 family peptidase [Planctomycetota bacterium]